MFGFSRQSRRVLNIYITLASSAEKCACGSRLRVELYSYINTPLLQEPRKHPINRTICIVSEEDCAIKEPEPEPVRPPESSYDEAIDNILNTLSEASPLPPIDSTPRSMFDIPILNDSRVSESVGRFVERCDSVMSVVSAPSPTFPRIDELIQDEVTVTTSPPPLSPVFNMERRRSLDPSLLSRPQTHSPVIRGRRNANANRLPLNENRLQSETIRRISTDPLRNARIPTDALRTAGKISADTIPSTKMARTGRQCKSRKTSLPNINKNNHIVRANSYVHS